MKIPFFTALMYVRLLACVNRRCAATREKHMFNLILNLLLWHVVWLCSKKCAAQAVHVFWNNLLWETGRAAEHKCTAHSPAPHTRIVNEDGFTDPSYLILPISFNFSFLVFFSFPCDANGLSSPFRVAATAAAVATTFVCARARSLTMKKVHK